MPMAVCPNARAEPPLWLHPWLWMLLALVLTGAAFVWARIIPDDEIPLDLAQLPVLCAGIVAAGVSVWMRCAHPRSSGIDDLPAYQRSLALLVIAVIHGALAVTVTVLLVAKYLAPVPTAGGGSMVWPIILWVLVVPWCAWSAWRLFGALASRQNDSSMWGRFETAVLVTQAGLAAFLGSWALYWGPQSSDSWDSLRLFLGALAAFAFLAAPLVAASSPIRRVAVSTLVVVHFAAILTAVLGASPGPWIAAQAQHCIFRPYLDFMYLNNAYRFYSPDPGPASQLWYRIEYREGKVTHSRWGKIPDIDEFGQSAYATRVQVTRRVALTENISRVLPIPMTVRNADGEADIAPFVKIRDQHAPSPVNEGLLGNQPVANSLAVPYHPDLPLSLNYQCPTPAGMKMLSSFARHVLQLPHPEFPNAVPVTVRLYRVQHRIMPAEFLANGGDPRDWTLYLPYYMGKYNKDGELLDFRDPFMYWLLPILRENPQDPQSRLNFYVYKHAGDADWQPQMPPKW